MPAISCSPIASGEIGFRGRAIVPGPLRTRVAATFGVAPLVEAPFLDVLLTATPFVAGEPSEPAGAARREAFRAGRAAGTVSAGRSARVRGATIVLEV
jgi:hypothetical protein